MTTVSQFSKSQLKSIAVEKITTGEHITKATFARVKGFPYSDFRVIYDILLKEKQEKEQKAREKARFITFAKENKISQNELNAAVNLLSNVKMKDYSTGHSMGCTADFYIKGAKYNYTIAYKDTTDTYSKACTWRPTYGNFSIEIPLQVAKILHNYTFARVGGIDTFILKTTDKIKPCYWLQESGNKNSYSVQLVSGFITEGYHAKTYQDCQNWRNKEALRLKVARMGDKKDDYLKSRFVGFQDSIKAGNCKEGTAAFARKHGLDPKMGYQIGYLISLEDSTYTRRLMSLFA